MVRGFRHGRGRERSGTGVVGLRRLFSALHERERVCVCEREREGMRE
jgi:hypothetical protein